MEKEKKTTEEKIDMILGQVLTLQGQMTIMEGRFEKKIEKLEQKIEEQFEEKLEQKLEEKLEQKLEKKIEEKLELKLNLKLDKKFLEFKKELGIFLGGIFQEAEDKIDKNEREIKKLPCVSLKSKLKNFVSKTN